jgi:large subunit ribosomal protein L29
MKAMKIADVRKMSAQELANKISDSRDELMKLRFQQVSGQLTDTSRIRALRREVARMETILNEAQKTVVEGVA